ncbi:hypothetical protein niasHT_001094 [Heterodera trifolii]|uniref:Serine aminopeptidase S33 domain-containing protein n=1 Tax=Heterodera trifolii TaxID=157864 RepID=A0ABD2LYJ8_9BILA
MMLLLPSSLRSLPPRLFPYFSNTFQKAFYNASVPRPPMSPAEPFLGSGESDLFAMAVKFQTDNGQPIELKAVYQDTDPSPKAIPTEGKSRQSPTIVFVHGSPGSHKDFKYMMLPLREKGLRSVAFNWPGMGYTLFDRRLRLTNSERTAFARSLIDQLLPPPTELIFIGHSRGGENALRLAREYPGRTKALLLLNSCGFRPHKGVRPHLMIKIAAWLWALDSRLQHCLAPIFHKIYSFSSGLKTDNGFIAGISTITHCTYDFDKLKLLTDDLQKEQPQLKVLFAYSGKDHLIETEISEEFSRALGGPILISTTNPKEEDSELLAKFNQLTAGEHGQNRLSILFTKERHFLQKHQASFMAKCILSYIQ